VTEVRVPPSWDSSDTPMPRITPIKRKQTDRI
jgi:hypothetical protein